MNDQLQSRIDCYLLPNRCGGRRCRTEPRSHGFRGYHERMMSNEHKIRKHSTSPSIKLRDFSIPHLNHASMSTLFLFTTTLAISILSSQPQATLVQANSLSRTNIGSNNATLLSARDPLVRQHATNNEHHYQYDSHHHHLAPSSIPPNFVQLGVTKNNTLGNRLNAYGFLRSSAITSSANNQSIPVGNSDLTRLNENPNKGLFEKVCIGTSNRMSLQSNKPDHYQILVDRYRNCTYVIGNLELTWLVRDIGNRPIDLTFLESIREITGYLLIAYVEVEKIRMPNLQIIRGREVFKLNGRKDEYAIFVMQNNLKSLEMPNLREILAGDVGFFDNQDLCYIRNINWDEILNTGYAHRHSLNATVPGPECPSCHESCPDSCWGSGPEMCQKFSKTICPQQCDKGRCFGSGPRDCCHLFCAGGCTGPKQTDCLACKNFNNDGECIQECPSMRKYNPSKFIWETDPNGKYAFGATCVKECPEHLLRDNGACVRSCPTDKRSLNGECVPCAGTCAKNCQGVDIVNSGNIETFVNCTAIEGSITILDSSLNGYTEVGNNHTMGAKYESMHPSKLKVFETVQKITGHLNIQAANPLFTDLSFFRKLEYIDGRQTTDTFHALTIIRTSLTSLNLRSLKRVRGGVLIEENKNLCFSDSAQFSRIDVNKNPITIKNNRDTSECRASGLKCHDQCNRDGCWGPGQNECVTCANYKFEDHCVRNCPSTNQIGLLSYDSGNRTCSRCHTECRDGCSGGSAMQCKACKNNKDGPYCVQECPSHKYNESGICQECYKSCVDGCTGPANKLGEGGCNSCEKTVIDSISPSLIARCLRVNESCPEGYYQEYGAPVSDGHPLKPLERKPICRKCHPRCKSCTGYGTHKDVCDCAGYVANDQCEDSCPRDSYADERTRECMRCSRECNGCFGPTEADCLNCRVYRIYYDSSGPMASARVSDKVSSSGNGLRQTGNFNCTSQCPPEKPHRISESNLLDPYCSEDPGPDPDNPRIVSLGSTSVLFLLITSASITFCFLVYKCKTDEDKLSTVKLTMRLSGFDDVEPLNQSNLKPNLAPLRSIKQTELRQGELIGSGVGGTVYQGMWFPEGQEDKKPVYVAIKILRESNTNKEFLDEAYIMASVNHPNLVKLLAVCMTPTQLILVTPLIPLGCLLDYVKTPKNRNEITSKNLLEWGKQIAKGMAYLEEHRMVHRDLALRNVLLQTKQKCLISDFGLAKFLEIDQSEYKVAPSGETRLPIKWLAPECIRERKFTHKSDVWAFGVTIWELVTFGRPPFEKLDIRQVIDEIEKGARLSKPEHVSAEIYKVMLSCWLPVPETRPDFKTLAENFVNFARDPERYLPLDMQNPDEFLMRNSDSEDNEHGMIYEVESDSIDDETSPPTSAQCLINYQNETFRFDTTRIHHSESETPNGHLMTPTLLAHKDIYPKNQDDAFSSRSTRQMSIKGSNATITDPNNNFPNGGFMPVSNHARSNADSCWTVNHTVSTNSLGQRSEQPTDSDDYLMPSQFSSEDKFSEFLNNRHEHRHQIGRLPPRPPSNHDPPHSAGLIGISNEEYFLTRRNYAYANSATNASSGHIPQSYV